MKETFLLNNRPEEWQPDMTITDLLKIKNYTFRMLVIKINGKLIKKIDYDSVFIPKASQVQILHLMSGG